MQLVNRVYCYLHQIVPYLYASINQHHQSMTLKNKFMPSSPSAPSTATWHNNSLCHNKHKFQCGGFFLMSVILGIFCLFPLTAPLWPVKNSLNLQFLKKVLKMWLLFQKKIIPQTGIQLIQLNNCRSFENA